jgi:hypothetical protein
LFEQQTNCTTTAMPTSTAPVAAPLPRGRAVEMNDWVDETFRYITTKSQPLDEETPPSWPSVRVPLTLAFRYTRPSAWYEWSEELRATRETACAETVEEILERFRQHNEAINGEARCDILATYVYNRAPPPDSGAAPVTCLEHMDEALLVDFLRHRKREHNGVLQGFVVPTGGRATCLRARVHASGRFMLESRTNRVPLADARRGVRERAVTFEGAEHEVRGRPVAPGTAVHAAAVALARQVCDHVLRLLPRQYAVHEATFYLRVQGDCQLYLLYAPVVGLALRETGAPLPQPLPKSPRAVEPELSFMGALPRDYFRCPTCGAAARHHHCTKVPFKSVLMHVCVLDASDGVVDGDNEVPQRAIRRNSAQSSDAVPASLPRRSRRSTRSSTASPRTRSTGPSCTRRPSARGRVSRRCGSSGARGTRAATLSWMISWRRRASARASGCFRRRCVT